MARSRLLLVVSVLLGIAGAACTASGAGESEQTGVTLRLGYFPNITHATAIVGIEEGILARHLGDEVKLEVQTFNAGGQAVEAIFAEGLDASFIGPSPAINAFVKSDGEAIRIVAGATSGGAFFVVQPGIDDAEDLRGNQLATPQAGNTQDLALRSWLREQGLETQSDRPDVEIRPQENSQTLETFRSRAIEGAWVPEPWASRLLLEAGGKVMVDERDLWPEGKYATTVLVVRTEFLEQHPGVVEDLVAGHVEANDFVNANPEEAKGVTAAAIARVTGRTLPKEVVDNAWSNLTFTLDPISSSFQRSAEQAAELGFLEEPELQGIYNVTHLNNVLKSAGKPDIKV